MKKSWTIIKAFWQRALTYRFTVLTYRIGEICELLVLILMWRAIYDGQEMIAGFTFAEMVTYLLIGNFFQAIIRNFLSGVVARDIKDGRLSMFLIRPIGYFHYILVQEIGRISLATILSVLSQFLVILFFLHIFVWNFDGLTLLLIFVMIFLAFLVELLLSYLIGLIAFWTDEVDGLYASLERIKKFFSGGYFPIHLLSSLFVQLSFLFPFAYSFYIPAQLYLKKIDKSIGLQGILIQCLWMIILYAIIRFVWQRGLKKYEATGM